MFRRKKKVNFDNMTLEEMDKMIMENPSKNNNDFTPLVIVPENPKCDKCGGELFVVQPIIEMDGRKLLECKDCHERIYLFIDILE